VIQNSTIQRRMPKGSTFQGYMAQSNLLRKTFFALTAAGLTALLLAAPAHAQSAAPKPTAGKPAASPGAPPEAQAIFTTWDSDSNGVLSLIEFQNGWLMLRRAGEIEARLHEQFKAIDANHDGAIDAGEYANLVLVKRAGASAQPLSAFDANKNQRLEFGEYMALVRRMSAPRPATTAPKKSP
jgi:hypothetical protein